MKLYPLKFDPIFKERLWGGTKLADVLGKQTHGQTIGESWELSAVEGNVSIVANGPLKGRSLKDLIEEDAEELLGDRVLARFGTEFPVLIKFIDARLDLSIQLHPDDALARERHNSFGKTEMWYIMDADPGAKLIVGFNRDVTREAYINSLKEGNLLDLMNFETVSEGDTYFINTGKIHAIGAGVMLAEIQQTSDITYRVYDYDRKDAQGNTRELHTDLALDAIDFKKRDDFRVTYPREPNRQNDMVTSPYFITSYLELDRNLEQRELKKGTFTILICVSGKATIENEEGSVEVNRGETVLVPAGSSYFKIRTKQSKFLEVTL